MRRFWTAYTLQPEFTRATLLLDMVGEDSRHNHVMKIKRFNIIDRNTNDANGKQTNLIFVRFQLQSHVIKEDQAAMKDEGRSVVDELFKRKQEILSIMN